MTVQELIDRLVQLPPHMQVVMPSEDDDFALVDSAFIDTVWIEGDTVQLADERDDQWLEAVRLYGPDAD